MTFPHVPGTAIHPRSRIRHNKLEMVQDRSSATGISRMLRKNICEPELAARHLDLPSACDLQ